MRRAGLLPVSVFVLMIPVAGHAQTDCSTIPAGPARTDCYIALSRFHGAQSDAAAGKARVQSDAARYRQVTGGSRAKSRRRQP